VLARLQGCVPAGVRLVRLTGADPTQLIDAWVGAPRAFVVDAMVSGLPPGAVRRFDAAAAPLPAEVQLFSTHAMGSGAGIEMARVLGCLPGALAVYAVEGATFTLGAGLGPAVAAGAAEAADRILEELRHA
jgi:hydrogenase maturation protease